MFFNKSLSEGRVRESVHCEPGKGCIGVVLATEESCDEVAYDLILCDLRAVVVL